jgi:hypothetical protein
MALQLTKKMISTTAIGLSASRRFRIQYVSDLHLECYSKFYLNKLVKPAAPYLALAGDIGNPSCPMWVPFFDYVSKNWERVFYVTGTKEYSATIPFNKQHSIIKTTLRPYPNVSLLDATNPSFYFPKENVTMIGSTLWSYKKGDEYTNTLHSLDKARLETYINFWTYQKANIVMLTHHMPSYKLIGSRFKENYDNALYASNCESLITPQVKAWIYGRTHNVSNIVLDTTLAVVNARGYPLEQVPGFTTEAFIELNLGPEEPIGADIDLSMAATGIIYPSA